MLMTYLSLVQQIKDYANRTDTYFVNNIKYFISQAQDRINRESKDIGEQISADGTFSVGNPIVTKPTNWNKTISFQYGTVEAPTIETTVLFLRSYEFCRMYWPSTNLKAPPIFYADNGNQPYNSFLLAPTPDQAYKYQLVYLNRPQDIGDIEGLPSENYLTQRFPDLLIYACMVEATPFLKDDERTPVWESMYNRALQSANLQTKDRYTDRSSVRDKD